MRSQDSGAWGGFGQENFGGCQLGDARLTQRAVHTGELMLRHPGGTPPDKLNGPADLMGFYRLVNNDKVTHDNLLECHVEQTRAKMVSAVGVVLAIHDTTELDYWGLDSVAGLGPIGNGGHRGMLCHNSLAYDYTGREVLGLANQVLHIRRQVAKGETTRNKRKHPERESRLWKKGCQGIPASGPGVLIVNVSDRGSDTFEYMEAQSASGRSYCLRSKSSRNVEVWTGESPQRVKLHEWARGLPALGEQTVSVGQNTGQAAREAVVRVASGAVRILPPQAHRGEHGDQPLSVWIVHVRELAPPRGASPLEWFVLTNVPTDGLTQAVERLDWYRCRGVIEEFHKAQKTGCGIEELQFTTRRALSAAIAMISVVATQLLRLRDLSRRPDGQDRPATDVVSSDYVEVLSAWRWKIRRTDLSVREFFWALARMGGHQNRRGDRDPGWLVLWRGWTKLQLMVDGARAIRLKRCV
jgi:hypothetical protein